MVCRVRLRDPAGYMCSPLTPAGEWGCCGGMIVELGGRGCEKVEADDWATAAS